MSVRNTIIKGTFILTISSILSRILGFVFKIMLSRAVGSEFFGLYQMVIPIAALCIAVCSGGVQTAAQKYIASCMASGNKNRAHGFLAASLIISIILCIPICTVLYTGSFVIADRFFSDTRLVIPLQLIALSIIPACIHGCINSFFIGCSKTLVPSMAQLLEQLVRIGVIYIIIYKNSASPSPAIGFYGMLGGELASSIFSSMIYLYKKGTVRIDIKNTFPDIIHMAVPLTATRFFMHVFQSLEAVLIPASLAVSGLAYNDALSVYGIITGMALPLVLLPCALVNSFSTMLLPVISAAQTGKNDNSIQRTGKFSTACSIYAGILCTAEFITFGPDAGYLLFQNSEIGIYIQILAWLCPFMYLCITLTSILNGLGCTRATFAVSMTATLIRIAIIAAITPVLGIRAILISMLAGQLCASAMLIMYSSKKISLTFNAVHLIVLPILLSACASVISGYIYSKLCFPDVINLLIGGSILAVMYIVPVFVYSQDEFTI